MGLLSKAVQGCIRKSEINLDKARINSNKARKILETYRYKSKSDYNEFVRARRLFVWYAWVASRWIGLGRKIADLRDILT